MATKSIQAFYLQAETIEALKTRADTIGAGQSELADLLLRFGLAHLKDDAARALLEKRRAEPSPLRKNERAVMAVLETMTKEAAARGEALQIDGAIVADRAGLFRKEGFLALNACKLRGLVHSTEKTVPPAPPRFKAKTLTLWWLASVADANGSRLAHIASSSASR